ncbi:MAG TPA: InlB B-repeat-containing protein, partial [Candidatus Stercoripulliclostridium merdigallinarum]|nr:InlB B-repeat-containing protein [Candidatus Stercoripulliclostridium merdigallinarum]
MKKCALILILILAGLAVLTACTDPVEVASIAVSDKAEDFKTDYIIGEELDLTGILLTVTRTDGESYDVYADDIKQDLRILNFSTERPVEKLTVILEYKGVRTSYEITVRTSEEGALRYTVTFNSMGGSAVEAQSVPAYSMAVAPADPVLSGYAFKGWYRESTYNNVFNFSTTNITADITLYARWAELHTVAFYGLRDGVDPETADPAVNPDDYVLLQYAEVAEGDAFTAIPAVPAKEGFSATWDRTVFSSVASDLDVYPIYTPIYHTVTFVVETADGERTVGSISHIRKGTYLQYADRTLNPEYAEIIEEFVAQVESMEIPGREFQGNWYPELTNQILSNVTFVANFGARYYDVTLLMNDGTDEVFATIGVQYNLTLNQNTIPGTPKRNGYVFNGWYSDPECNQAWNFTTAITGERTLYAGWRELLPVYFYIPTSSGLEFVTEPEYDEAIGYEADGVTYNLYQTVYVPIGDGVSATAAVVPQAVGHSGIWRYRENGQSFNGVTSLEEQAELYADYSRLNYTVRFIANNETVMTEEVPYQSTVVPPQDPTMPGYSFVHWTTGGAAVEDFSALKITSNIDFTAEFSANSYQVEFYYYANSATADHRISVQYGYSFTFPPVVQQGSRLTGWYAQNNYSTASQWGAGVPLTEANIESRTGTDVDFGALGVNSTVLTLYGGWVRQYTVTFQDEDCGSIGSAVTLDENTVVTADMAPTVAAREGYAQTWNLVEDGVLGGEYAFGTPITSNLVLRAKYSPLEYEVSFEIEFRYKDNTTKGSYIFSERTISVLHGNTIGAGANIPGAGNLSDNEKAAIAAGTGYEELPADFEIMWVNVNTDDITNTVINAADVRFKAYCYVRVFTVTWYSTEVGELTEDAVLQTASVEFGKSVPPYT